MKQKLLIACIAVLAVAAIAFGTLYFTNDADKTKTIQDKDSEIAVLAGDKETLTAEKDQLLADHTDAIAAKDGEIAALTAEKDQLAVDHAAAIEAKNADIAALTADKEALAAEKDQLALDHAAAIEAKDGEIATLNAEKAELEKSVEELTTLKKDLIDEKVYLEEAVKGKDDEIAALTTEKEQLVKDHAAVLEQKDGEIAALTTDKETLTAEKEQLVKDHAAVLEQKDGEMNALTAEKEKLAADHADALAAKDAEIQQLKDDHAKELEEKDAAFAALEEENAGMKTQIAQLEAGELPQPTEEPAAGATQEEAFSVVGEWTVVIDDKQLAQLNVSKEDYEMLKGFGFEVIMTFTEDGKAQLGAYMFGEPMEATVDAMQYEVMGDKIRFNVTVHNLEIKDANTIRIYSDTTDMTMNRR